MRHLISLILLFLSLPLTAIELSHGSIERSGSLYEIILPDLDNIGRFVDSYGYVSVEVPQTVSADDVEASYQTPGGATALERFSMKGLPPGPDSATTWVSFALPQILETDKSEIRFRVKSPGILSFARVLLGDPAKPTSRIIGAFGRIPYKNALTIHAGEDLLGTLSAVQHVRFPAGFLGMDTEAFDEMVEFGEAPFQPGVNNVDTVMIRLTDVAVGGTVPVHLLKFQNRSVNPITVQSARGPLQFEITARLSPNAISGGFVTINADGTYQSSTSLYPVFEFQRLDEAGRPSGAPIVVDTALRSIPGFPFYLASKGGRWSQTPPPGRLVTPASSNFFYDNGETNIFVHSNGPVEKISGEVQLAACAKLSAQ